MDRLSKLLMAIKSDEYSSFLEQLPLNVPGLSKNLMHHNGATYIEVSRNQDRKALVFPKYGIISKTIKNKEAQRSELHTRYRFLRNKILHSKSCRYSEGV